MDGHVGPLAALDGRALAQLMPLHVAVSGDGIITAAGPTLARLAPDQTLPGQPFFAVFHVRRPCGIMTVPGLLTKAGQRIDIGFRTGPPTPLRGLAVPLSDGGALINLSLGIGLIEAVRRHQLTDADFAATDLAVEMLYLVEAKSAVMEELRDLNLRLQGARKRAEEQALTDTLTGLRNRRGLELAMQGLLDGGAAFALMHLDLDFFKQVNDSLGHAAGDHVLTQVAAGLLAETRAGDTVARVGGDEFVVLLPGLSDSDRIAQIAERIIAHLARPVPFEGHLCRISASIGVVLSVDYHRPEAARLQADADAALYASKRAGRNTVRLFHP